MNRYLVGGAVLVAFVSTGLLQVAMAQLPMAIQRYNDPAKPYAYSAVSGAQYGLAIGTATALTVPATAKCAYFTLEGAAVRRTSDGTAASTMVGTVIGQGASWMDCGPLTAYQFTAIAGSPKLNVEYFK